ncbi:MBL fold metallo-hydrolase [Pseudoroseomonas wenyumeiae]|uniref:MBL fold metallo-hydrolase n=1 Tax=Teichococcus wenyumeiae TaxID=2478470 RepID=A0A3A9JFP9_9PROT|nr:MBL fold metallo-hydrolase [Pseudoroseomonas wenyumeiae]RKK02394.1 MBL fold metallo-hydrolase [Pseudoroseomonas wenyumeiae]RMI15246.1 MBL fold metallo-hydrolase [Pseudoroseomonas wenyumeiae]
MLPARFEWTRRHALSAIMIGGTVGFGRGEASAAAPMLGPARPRHYRFELGRFEVTMLLDAEAAIDGPWPVIGSNSSQAEVDRLMSDNLLPTHKYQPGFTPMIVNTGEQLILFDTGNGAKGFVPHPYGGWLVDVLAPAGFAAEAIDLVVLSHGHPDHIGGMFENGRPLFPNARYTIGQVEYDFWARERGHSGPLEAFAALFREYVVPVADRTSFLKPGAEVARGIRTVEAYGHTPGHLCFHLESEGERLFFLGDCCHHHVASLARPDWHTVFDTDPIQGAATRARMFDMLATERIAVSAFHMPFPSLGFVERQGSGYRWVQHSYQLTL